jgi:hypothetical protein
MAKSYLRGHPIEYKNGQWVFCDNQEPTKDTYNERPCGKCGAFQTEEGHDPCLQTLPGTMNACCGHGIQSSAYIQFLDGFSIHGLDALVVLNVLKKYAS